MHKNQTGSAVPLEGAVLETLAAGVILPDEVKLHIEKGADGLVEIILDFKAGGQLRIKPDAWGADVHNSIAPWLKTAFSFEMDQAPIAGTETANPQIWVSLDQVSNGDIVESFATTKADASV